MHIAAAHKQLSELASWFGELEVQLRQAELKQSEVTPNAITMILHLHGEGEGSGPILQVMKNFSVGAGCHMFVLSDID